MNVYEVINQRIIALLEEGTCPWKKPWHSGMPKNLVSGKAYRGINTFLLGVQQFDSPYWLTFKQCSMLGGRIKSNSKSVPVVFWKILEEEDGKVQLLRYYQVFNVEQTEGLKIPTVESISNPFVPMYRAESIMAKMPMKPEVRHGGGRAFYSPRFDYIQMPSQSSFDSPEEYYCTCFHELTHATGHESRLARKSITEPSYFGSHEYSKEELIAEMGAAFLCGHAGIENRTIQNSAAYLAGWIKVLRGDKTLLVHAAAAAQKACDYVMGESDMVTE